jgi:hypothetical protein
MNLLMAIVEGLFSMDGGSNEWRELFATLKRSYYLKAFMQE